MKGPSNARNRLSFGPFDVDFSSGELCKRGLKVHLQGQPFCILSILLERPGEVVTREEIQSKLWPDGTFVDFDEGLDTALKKLRYALGDSAQHPTFIETIPRRGYRFIAPVSDRAIPESATNSRGESAASERVPEWGKDSQPDIFRASEAEVPFAPQVALGQQKRKYIVPILTALAVLVAAGLGQWRWFSQGNRPDLERMTITKLTDAGNAAQVAISPDGQNVVYARRDGIEQSLWVKHIATRTEVQILPPDNVNFTGLAFSPDGNSVYFVRSDRNNFVFGYLYRMPTWGGPAQQLIKDADTAVSFSPDGEQFVYTRGVPSRNVVEVRIANADASGDRLLTAIRNVWVFEPGATWSPDGRTIAVPVQLFGAQSRFVLCAVTVADGSVRELFSSYEKIGRAIWLPGSDALLASLDAPASHHGQLWTISYPKGEARRFTHDLGDYGMVIDRTHDSKTFAAVVTTEVSNIWSVPQNELAGAQQITSGEPALFEVVDLPDGKLLAAGSDLWIMNADGNRRSRFTNSHGAGGIVHCGRFIVFTSKESGTSVLTRVGVDGSNPAALASGDVLSPACSPDGKFVFYANHAHPEKIFRIPIEGGAPTEIADILGETIIGRLSVSPDGKLLAYPYQEFIPPAWKVAAVPAGGGSPVLIFRVPAGIRGISWSQDGKGLQYLMTSNGATNVWERPISGEEPRQLTRFTAGEIFDFKWTSDHTRLLLTRGSVSSDVILLSNLH